MRTLSPGLQAVLLRIEVLAPHPNRKLCGNQKSASDKIYVNINFIKKESGIFRALNSELSPKEM